MLRHELILYYSHDLVKFSLVVSLFQNSIYQRQSFLIDSGRAFCLHQKRPSTLEVCLDMHLAGSIHVTSSTGRHLVHS